MKIMFVAGEASGDMRGAEVIQALHRQHAKFTCSGIGGDAMQGAGCKLIAHAKDIAVVGLLEVLKHYPKIRQAWQAAVHALKTERPDLLVLIDYPGFNLRLAKVAHRVDIKVLYYISPQIWAWHQNRIKQIKRDVTHMAVVFPFEVAFYEQAGIPVTFVGHPLVSVMPKLTQQEARHQLSLPETGKIIALLPGSRNSEVMRLLPTLITAAALLQQHDPKLKFILPCASTIDINQLRAAIPTNLPINVIAPQNFTALSACDLAIGASGTVTLEAALLGRPMIIVYKINPLTYTLAKRLIKVKYIGLPNLLSNAMLMPELIQQAATPENIAAEARKFLEDTALYHRTVTALNSIQTTLGTFAAPEKVAELIVLLSNPQES